MANVDRIKRQLLRDLVQQNVDLIEGRPSRLRPRRDVLHLATRVAVLALLSVALFGSSRLISTLAEPRPVAAAARGLKIPAPRPLPARQSGAAPAGIPLTAPEPV